MLSERGDFYSILILMHYQLTGYVSSHEGFRFQIRLKRNSNSPTQILVFQSSKVTHETCQITNHQYCDH